MICKELTFLVIKSEIGAFETKKGERRQLLLKLSIISLSTVIAFPQLVSFH